MTNNDTQIRIKFAEGHETLIDNITATHIADGLLYIKWYDPDDNGAEQRTVINLAQTLFYTEGDQK